MTAALSQGPGEQPAESTGVVPAAPSPGAATAADRPSPPPTPEEPALTPFSDLVGKLLDGRYQIAAKVGEGGMCFVYRALDTGTSEKVAIKVLLPALLRDPVSMARLRREAELAGKLAHPNVCHIIRFGEAAPGFDYLVMPFIEGEMLCDRTGRMGVFPVEVATHFVRDMCAGLQTAHDCGVLHRDMKPENVMIVANPDGSERAVVMDFSLAKDLQFGSDLTAKGLVVGTPEFMSPEQLRGDALDARSDIYSLAFMVYEMLTGRLPFEAKSQNEIMIARLKGESIPLRHRRPDLEFPAGVERVLARALAHDTDQRYATAREFGDAFSRAAAGQDPDEGQNGAGIVSRMLSRLRSSVGRS